MTEIPIGTLVHYWPGVREGEGKTGRTLTTVRDLHGTPVVWIEGEAGCVALTHVEPLDRAHAIATEIMLARAYDVEHRPIEDLLSDSEDLSEADRERLADEIHGLIDKATVTVTFPEASDS